MGTIEMNRSIHVEYSSGDKSGSVKFWCPTPLSAIGSFHRYCQCERKKKPDEYRITRIYQSYIGGDGLNHDSDFDLPGGPNPVVACRDRPEAEAVEEQATFGF